jgi:UTP--glucose-1-phosphate uridylyltransferase
VSDGLNEAIDKMRAEGLGDAAVETFRHYYELLQGGDAGLLPEASLEPVDDVPDFDDLPDEDAGEALDQAIVLKLNGGLGTSMGMTKAKSLLEVKGGMTFLDVIVRQVLHLRGETGARLPLVLMNSFNTRDDSLEALKRHPGIEVEGLPLDFVQNKVPKILAADLTPATWEPNPANEWAPPGHGDLYTALVTSGLLTQLLEGGYRYAFVSNSDNLGAVFEPRTLAWFAREGIPFLLEVTDRTQADRKGGHVAKRDTGGLVLREVAQTPDEDLDAFQDIERHRFFNTNNLWLDLRALQDTLDANDGVLGLPMIVNRKTVDPSDKTSPEVIQLETAMGAAIDVFDGAQALRVPRGRFVPVKTTSDLLIVRSDAYVLDDQERLTLSPGREKAPLVDLDTEIYKLLDDFDQRFPRGAPSLREAERLVVKGDVTFGAGVVVRGNVTVNGPRQIPDGEVLQT